MIYLCCDNANVHTVIDKKFGCDCIRNIIDLYFRSYGTAFDFAQFYIQKSTENNCETAIILRYNQTVYLASDSNCDIEELSDFLSGFNDIDLISDVPLALSRSGSICAVMSKNGVADSVQNSDVVLYNELKAVSDLVCEGMSEQKKTDFYLNTSHQVRHSLLLVYAYLKDSAPVSVASVFLSDSSAVIPFVYTGEYFRGNGYSREVLSALCSNSQIAYQLLCEEHNIKFYEKCGFVQVESWMKYSL